MAKKDANDTRRGLRVVTDLSQQRLDARKAGRKPTCGSPLAGANIPGHKNYQTDKRCQRPAGAGTDHPGYGACSWHTGNMPSAKRTAAREHAAETVDKLRSDMRFYGVHVEVSFEQALLEELQRTVGIVRWIEGKLAAWGQVDGQDEPSWASNPTGMPELLAEHFSYRTVVISDSEHAAWLRQYQFERRHLHALAADGIKAGIAEKLIATTARQADLQYAILSRALDVLAPDAKDRIPQVLPQVVREITGKPA